MKCISGNFPKFSVHIFLCKQLWMDRLGIIIFLQTFAISLTFSLAFILTLSDVFRSFLSPSLQCKWKNKKRSTECNLPMKIFWYISSQLQIFFYWNLASFIFLPYIIYIKLSTLRSISFHSSKKTIVNESGYLSHIVLGKNWSNSKFSISTRVTEMYLYKKILYNLFKPLSCFSYLTNCLLIIIQTVWNCSVFPPRKLFHKVS